MGTKGDYCDWSHDLLLLLFHSDVLWFCEFGLRCSNSFTNAKLETTIQVLSLGLKLHRTHTMHLCHGTMQFIQYHASFVSMHYIYLSFVFVTQFMTSVPYALIAMGIATMFYKYIEYRG